MGMDQSTTELAVTLRISPETRERIVRRATASGQEVDEYLSGIVERAADRPLDLAAISGPVQQRFLESGMTDNDLGDLLETAKHRMRAQRQARGTS
jgi:hypothetical protein